MVIFRFFKTAASHHLQILEILMADKLWRCQMHQIAKFHQNRSSGCKDIAISQVFQDGSHPPSWIQFPHYWTTMTHIWWSLLLCKIWLQSMQ